MTSKMLHILESNVDSIKYMFFTSFIYQKETFRGSPQVPHKYHLFGTYVILRLGLDTQLVNYKNTLNINYGFSGKSKGDALS